MLDYAAWAGAKGIEIKAFETVSIPVSTLKEVAASQGTTFQKGDILFIRSGWNRAYETLSDVGRQTLADYKVPPAIGIESSEDTLRWLWDQSFAAVAGDQPAMEAWPCQNPQFWLHEWLLAGWGMPIGELFDLERLSEECRKRKRYTFFLQQCAIKGAEHAQCIQGWVFSLTIISGSRWCCQSSQRSGHLLVPYPSLFEPAANHCYCGPEGLS